MASFVKTTLGLGLTVGLLAASPAGAVRDLTAKGKQTSNVSLYGATHTIDNTSSKTLRGPQGADTVSAVPEPANWLMMLVGFGLLGAMNRRSNSDRLRDEMVL